MSDIVTLQIHFNRLEYSKICLNSYFQNVKTPHRLVVWDNGSKDGTTEFLRSIQANVELLKSLTFEVVFYFNDHNMRWADVLNKVWSDHSDAKYLGYCPNDMLITSDWIKDHVERFRCHEPQDRLAVVSDPISDRERQQGQEPFEWTGNVITQDKFGDVPTDCMPSIMRGDLYRKFGPFEEGGGMGALIFGQGLFRQNGYVVGWSPIRHSELIMYHPLLSFEDTPKYKLYREYLHQYKRNLLGEGKTPPPDMYKDLTYGID